MTSNPAIPHTAAATPSPNDLLAVQVADALMAAGLIKDSHRAELLSKLKSGGVRQDDWNLWVDLATAQQEAAEETGNE